MDSDLSSLRIDSRHYPFTPEFICENPYGLRLFGRKGCNDHPGDTGLQPAGGVLDRTDTPTQLDLDTGLFDQVGNKPDILRCVPERSVKVHYVEGISSEAKPAGRTGKRVSECRCSLSSALNQLDALTSQDINCRKDTHTSQRIIRWMAITRISFAPARLRALMRE